MKRVFVSSSGLLKSVKFAVEFSVCAFFFFNSYGSVSPSLRCDTELEQRAAAVRSLPHIPAMLFFTVVGDHSSLIHQTGTEHMLFRLCFSRAWKEVKATSVRSRWWHQFTLFFAVLSVLWSVFQGQFLGGEFAHCCMCWFPPSVEQWAAGTCSSGVNQFSVSSLCWLFSPYY